MFWTQGAKVAPESLFWFLFFFFVFLSLFLIDKKPVFPPRKGHFCLFSMFLFLSPLTCFGLPLFLFLFLCLSLSLVFLSSFLWRTAVQMGGVLQYKWEVYCWVSLSSRLRSQEGPAIQMGGRCTAVLSSRPVGVGVSETLLILHHQNPVLHRCNSLLHQCKRPLVPLAKKTFFRADKTMTATDVTGFDAIFSTGFFATFSRF